MIGRRAVSALAVATSLLVLSSPALAGSHKTWGKAGVSLADYSADSLACTEAAAQMDLSDTAPAHALASMVQLPNGQWGYRNFEYSAMYRLPSREVQLNRLTAIMRHEIERCLAGRGYVEFALTGAQARMLQGLEQGSDARRAYLHGLASDPNVLAAQGVSES